MNQEAALTYLRARLEADPRTSNAIALAAGVTPSAVYRFASGERSLDWPAMVRLGAAMGVDVDITITELRP